MMPTNIDERSKPDLDFWKNFLNERAKELGLEENVKVVKSAEVDVVTWAFEMEEGELIDLGWSVEAAEAALRDIAGQ